MLILESLYDEYSLDEIVVAECLSNSERPYSIVNCNATTRAAIEEYRDLMRIALEKFKQSMKRVSIWAVACVKHGFTDENTFTDLRYRAGVNRKSLVQAIQ